MSDPPPPPGPESPPTTQYPAATGHEPDPARTNPLAESSLDWEPPPPVTFAGPLLPNYELLDELGRGGMGVVYKARQAQTGRLVALKMVLAGGAASPADRARFQVEAEAVARLDHPGIVRLYEVSEHLGTPFLSLEYLEGGSLATRLKSGMLPLPEGVRLVAAVARAVAHAHERGVLHRDLKPANILLGADGRPRVGDFGLAKQLDDGRSLTGTGAVLGTPAYMAPEQAGGGAVTTLVDVYSLGAILYQLITGRPPFEGATVLSILRSVQSDPPDPPARVNPAVDPALEAVCLRCLAKAPGERYLSAAALAEDLEHWLAGEPVTARPPGVGTLLWLWLRDNVRATAWTVAIGIFCGFVAAGGIGLPPLLEWFGRHAEVAGHLHQPWWVRFPRASTGWQFMILPLATSGAFTGMGLLTGLLVRPKDRGADLLTGLVTGVLAGVTAFVVAGGWGAAQSLALTPAIADVQILRDWSQQAREPAARQAGPDPFLAAYPELADLPPSDRIDLVAEKILAEVATGTAVAIWVGFVVTVGLFAASGVYGTLIAGLLRRRTMPWPDLVLRYLQATVPSCLLTLAVYMQVFFSRGDWGGGPSSGWLAVLLMVGFTGLAGMAVTRDWPGMAWVALYLAAFLIFQGLIGTHLPWYVWLGAVAGLAGSVLAAVRPTVRQRIAAAE